jgi:hypothetical protein
MDASKANKLPRQCDRKKVEATEDQLVIFFLKLPVNLILIPLSPETLKP